MRRQTAIHFPDSMRALVLTAFDGKPKIQKMEVPTPGKHEVLIEIDSSPINPSDYSFIRGLYSTKKTLPVIPGFEASGKVVATGNDFMSKRLLGKHVACFAPMNGDGTWAEYMVTKNNLVVPLKTGMDLEQGSMLMVNPLSAIAMLDMAKKAGRSAIANTAAASALGQMLNSLCIDRGLPLVNVVRRDEQVELLKNQGAKYVLNSSSVKFVSELSALFTRLNVGLAFDAVAGKMTFDLLEALPSGSEVVVYGGLSEQPASAHPGKLIFENKKVSGFWLSEWITRQPMLKLLWTFNGIQKYISHKHRTVIHKRIPLNEFAVGIKLYLNNMTAGKLLLKPALK